MQVNIALLTVTDSRTFDTDKSGAILVKKINEQKHKLIERKARRLGKNNRRKYSLNKMAEKFNKILDNVLASIPSSVNLKLPKLKKVGSEKSKSQTTIKLPKLKKAT